MLHEPAVTQGKDPASGYKMRLGAWMFALYALVYAGFVAINLLDPTMMEAVVLLDLNFAVVYGFGLIVFALILAVIYNQLCNWEESRLSGGGN